MTGALDGVRVVELGGIGPGPFGCMVLADLGADVVRVERPGTGPDIGDSLLRGRRVVTADLKAAVDVAAVRRLIAAADVLVEGFRPGVTERLGLGPADCTADNPRLVYARITGYGQDGPLATRAGHDITYLAVTGELHGLGPAGHRPVPPVNLVADFGGGGMLLALGVTAALVERQRSGLGQVIDVAMVDGAALLGTFLAGPRAAGTWSDERGTNLLDGGAPFYDTYETSDGRWVAVGALEPQFYLALLAGLGLDPATLPDRDDSAAWPQLRERFAAVFAEASREHWESVFGATDACVVPVLTPAEAAKHPHTVARAGRVVLDGVTQPSPAPRLSRTPGSTAPARSAVLADVLAQWAAPLR